MNLSRKDVTGREVGRGLFALVDAWMRDELAKGAVLFSLIAIGAGVTTPGVGWVMGGLVLGVLGSVLGIMAARDRWSSPVTWLVVVAVLGADIAFMTAAWTMGG